MHNCICLTFALLCINVSSKPIQEDAKLHFLDFSPQCFLKYTSRLPEKLDAKSHHRWGKVTLIAFFWNISTVCFYLSTQIACLWGCKVTWLHLFDFSPLYVFKCLLKWTGTEDSYSIVTMLALFRFFSTVEALSHWLHLFDFSPLCIFKCVLKLPAWTDAKSHCLHLFGFSPLWVFKCVLKLPAWEEA